MIQVIVFMKDHDQGKTQRRQIKQNWAIRHSGLDPESSAIAKSELPGCPRIMMRDKLLKSGMT
jgi:hypothetical protein